MAMTKERLEEAKYLVDHSMDDGELAEVARELIAEVERLQKIEARAKPLLELDAQTKDLRELSAKVISKINRAGEPFVETVDLDEWTGSSNDSRSQRSS